MDIGVNLVEFLDDLGVNRAEDLAVRMCDREFNLFLGGENTVGQRGCEGKATKKLGKLAAGKFESHL